MEIKVIIDPECTEPRVTIHTHEMSEAVVEILRRLQASKAAFLTGISGKEVQILDPADIIRVVVSSGVVTALTKDGEFRLRGPLYEAEAKLGTDDFARISQSEIINIHEVERFDFSESGTIRVVFRNGVSSYVSRRYIQRIRKLLGI